MSDESEQKAARGSRIADLFHNEVTAWIVLAVSLGVTALGWYIAKTYVDKRAADRFVFEISDAKQRIVDRMLEYEQVLRGGVALFRTVDRMVSRDEWRTYVDSLQIQTYFPGIQGIGYAQMLQPHELASHEASVRAEGFDGYAVKPAGDRELYSAIVYLEPFDWRNRRAFGFDMYSNPMRRSAMDHARDTGEPSVSGRVILVQETDEDVQAGFLMYLPLYARGVPLETAEQRRAALLGYVYSPFRMADLMRGILGSDTPDVGFSIYDGTDAQTRDTLLYRDASQAEGDAHRRMTLPVELPGRTWMAEFHSTPRFEATMSSRQPELIAIGGVIVDILLFSIIWGLGTERRRVHRKAERMTADIRKAAERMQVAQDAARFGTWEFNLRNERLYWDARMLEMYGVPAERFGGALADWRARVYPDDLAKTEAQLHDAIAHCGSFDAEFRILRDDGEIRWIEAHAVVLADTHGQAGRIIGVNLDVTERKQSAEKLQLAASVFDKAQEGIIIAGTDQRIIDVNPAFTQVTGYQRDEVVGRTPAFLRSGKHDKDFYAGIWRQIAAQGYWRGEIWNRRKSGEMFAQMQTISVVKDEHGEPIRYIAVFSDITTLIEQQDKLERMAHYDALTGLPNRVLLADRMQQAMAVARRTNKLLAVCYLDLDGFKPVNDRHGHAAGDRLLIQVAERLKQHVRESDSIARLGGDEFVILLSDVDDMVACDIALERLVAALTDLYVLDDGLKVSVSASIGVTLYPDDDNDADTLLRHADHAMYIAKEQGRAGFQIFDAEHSQQMREHRQTLSRIGEALDADEFVLHYQPKVNMRSGKVVGAEALIRWNHPERGLLPPFEFLPLIEGDALSVAVDTWVIGEAMRQLSRWIDQGLEIKVSINVSGRFLQGDGFVTGLAQELARHPEVTPRLLEIEVLETAALDDVGRVSQIIDQCRALGVSVSLDDFGTGYSSLTYLRRLPADTLKIDRSFVRDMLSDPEDLAIVEGIVGLSEAFRRHVIAEGVETEDHGKLLLRMGCSLGQGFGIARPMPAAELPAWVRSYVVPDSWKDARMAHWRRDDLPLYAAEFHHCEWIDRLVQMFESDTGEMLPAQHDYAHCQFTHWYHNEGRQRYGHLAEFVDVREVHEEVHALASLILDLLARGRDDEAMDELARLLELRYELLQRFETLQRTLDDMEPPAARYAVGGRAA